jgi:hypothetical protein
MAAAISPDRKQLRTMEIEPGKFALVANRS